MSDFRPAASSTRPPHSTMCGMFALFLILLPLPLGTNRPLAIAIAAVVLATLGLVVSLFGLLSKHPPQNPSWPRRLKIAAFLSGGVILWGCVQAYVPMPTEWAHPVWALTPTPCTGVISVNPYAFPEALLAHLLALGAFVIAWFIGSAPPPEGRQQAWRVIKIFVGAATLYALYGLVMVASGTEKVLMYEKTMYRGFVSSTFINKNTWATWAGIATLAGWAWCRDSLRQQKTALATREAAPTRALQRIQRLQVGLAMSGLPIAMTGIMALGVVLSGSRAGLISTFVAVLALEGFYALRQHKSRRERTVTHGWRLLRTLLIMGLGFVFVIPTGFLARLDPNKVDSDQAVRVAAWTRIGEALTERPLQGFGWGSFEAAFRLYKDEGFGLWFHHAHNDWLESAFELGVPAFTVRLAALALVVSLAWRAVRTRRRGALLGALALAVTVLVGLHGLVDFSVQVPAVTVAWCAFLGLGAAQGNITGTSQLFDADERVNPHG